MAEDEDRSFGRQVVARAWFAAWAFFESSVRDVILFGVALASGGAAYWFIYGLPATEDQIVPVLIFTVGPIVAIWLLLFVWHLWLAPHALAYEAARRALVAKPAQPSTAAVIRKIQEPPVNWMIWKQRASYTLVEFSGILAKTDPNAAMGEAGKGEQAGFMDLIKEAAMNRALPIAGDRHVRSEQPDLYPSYFTVKKADAIKWAETKGFDVEHIK